MRLNAALNRWREMEPPSAGEQPSEKMEINSLTLKSWGVGKERKGGGLCRREGLCRRAYFCVSIQFCPVFTLPHPKLSPRVCNEPNSRIVIRNSTDYTLCF